ncbi:MAG: hypothetical protein AB7I24_10115 [Candidatus Nanopelagicales bacterium]
MRRGAARRIGVVAVSAVLCLGVPPAASAAAPPPGSPVTSFGGGDGTVRVPLSHLPTWSDNQRWTAHDTPLLIDAVRSGPAAGSFRALVGSSYRDASTLSERAYRSDGSVDTSWNRGRPLVLARYSPDEGLATIQADALRRFYVAEVGLEGGVRLRRTTSRGLWDPSYPSPWVDPAGFTWSPAIAVSPAGRVRLCHSPIGVDAVLAVTDVDNAGAVVGDHRVDLSSVAVRAVCQTALFLPDRSAVLGIALFDESPTRREALIRVMPTGELDPSYGTGGVLLLPTSISGSTLAGMTASGGGVVVSALSTVSGTSRPALLVTTATGSLDPSFGYGGVLRLAHPGTGVAEVVRDGHGGWFVCLVAQTRPRGGTTVDPGLLHLDARGRPVAAFGRNGYLRFGPGVSAAGTGPTTVVVFGSGRMLVGLSEQRFSSDRVIGIGARIDKRWS